MELSGGVKRLELVYRVYARQAEDSNLRLAAVREKVLEVIPEAVCILEEPYAVRIEPEKVEAARARGLLIVERGDDPFMLYLYGMRIEIRDFYPGIFIGKAIFDEIPWAVMRIVKDFPTEFVAE